MAAKNTTKNTTKNVDALDTEGAPTMDFEFNGDSFTTKVLRGRKWRDIRDNLAALNGIANPNVILPGQVLRLS